MDDRLSSADINSYHLAAYAGASLGDFAIRSGGAWTWHTIDTKRSIVFPGFFDHTEASYDGDTGQLFGEVALPYATSGTALEPFARLAYVHVSTDAFTESGGPAVLASLGADEDVGYSTLGLRAAATMAVAGTQVTPRAALAWRHAFGDVTPDLALSFGLSGPGFEIAGVLLARDSALVEAGLDFKITRDATLGVFYQGQLANDAQDHGITGRLDWRF